MEKDEINTRILSAITKILEGREDLNKTKLAQSFGIKPAKFTEILKGRMYAGVEMMSILTTDYGVSSSWLLTGSGPMFSSDSASNTVTGDGNVVGNNIVDSSVSTTIKDPSSLSQEQIRLLIKEYQKHIDSLDKSIASLESQLAAKDDMINRLLEIISKQ